MLQHVVLTDELPSCNEIHIDCGHGEGDAETHRDIILPRRNSVDCPECGIHYTWRPRTSR